MLHLTWYLCLVFTLKEEIVGERRPKDGEDVVTLRKT
jgi:hypothetical protein